MKKSNLIITLAVALILAVSSVGAILATTGVFASGSASIQSTQGAIQFDAPSGIRWNNGKKAFEIFNYAGITYIASEQYVNATGDIAANGDIAGYEKMDGLHTYHIMQDIVYEDTTAIYEPYRDASPNFGYLESDNVGVLDGRGFSLIGCPFRRTPIASPTSRSILFYMIYGSVRNLHIDTTDSYFTPDSQRLVTISIGLYGTVSGCEVTGVIYQPTALCIYGMVETVHQTGSMSNCVSYLDITSGTWVAGVVGGIYGSLIKCSSYGTMVTGEWAGGVAVKIFANGSAIDCANYGDITAIKLNGKAGGITSDCSGGATSTIIGCVNKGNITGGSDTGYAAGICGYGTMTAVVKLNNVNIGIIDAKNKFPLYNGIA